MNKLKGHNEGVVVDTYPIKISCFERCIEVMLSLASSRTCTGSCVRDFTRTDDLISKETRSYFDSE